MCQDVCKQPHLFMMVPSNEIDLIWIVKINWEMAHVLYRLQNKIKDWQECKLEEVQISLHALSGHNANNTIMSSSSCPLA